MMKLAPLHPSQQPLLDEPLNDAAMEQIILGMMSYAEHHNTGLVGQIAKDIGSVHVVDGIASAHGVMVQPQRDRTLQESRPLQLSLSRRTALTLCDRLLRDAAKAHGELANLLSCAALENLARAVRSAEADD